MVVITVGDFQALKFLTPVIAGEGHSAKINLPNSCKINKVVVPQIATFPCLA